MERGVDLRVFLAENLGVIGVGRGALQAVEDQLLESGRIVAQPHLPLGERDLAALANQPIQIAGRLPGGGPVERLGRLAGRGAGPFVHRLRPIADLGGVEQMPPQPLGVEIDVGDRGEEEFEDRPIDRRVAGVQFGRPMGVHRNALGGIHQQVLQVGGGRVLAADAILVATGSLRGLFALITEHIEFPWVGCVASIATVLTIEAYPARQVASLTWIKGGGEL